MKNKKDALDKWDLIGESVKGIGIAAVVATLFYNALYGLIPGSIVGMLFIRKDIRRIKEKKRKELLIAFRSLIGALDSALAAGYSLENAFLSAEQDMRQLYSEKSLINIELKSMKQKLLIRIPLWRLFFELGEKNNLDEIKDFALVIETAQKTGGNTIKIIRRTVENISMKIDVDQEIQVMVAAKEMEKRVMTVMPPIIILYLRVANGNFMKPLYEGVASILFMTICLGLILVADAIGEKIVRIEV